MKEKGPLRGMGKVYRFKTSREPGKEKVLRQGSGKSGVPGQKIWDILNVNCRVYDLVSCYII